MSATAAAAAPAAAGPPARTGSTTTQPQAAQATAAAGTPSRSGGVAVAVQMAFNAAPAAAAAAATINTVHVWVRRSGYGTETALSFTFKPTVTVGDALREAFTTLLRPSLEPPSNLELAFNGNPLPNMEVLTQALDAVSSKGPCTMASGVAGTGSTASGMPIGTLLDGRGSDASPVVLELRRRFRRSTVPTALHTLGGRGSLSPARRRTPSPPRRGASGTRTPLGGGGADTTPSPGGPLPPPCAFTPQWGSPMCGACGQHRRAHEEFPVTRVELQDRVLRSAAKRKASEPSKLCRERSTSPQAADTTTAAADSPAADAARTPTTGDRGRRLWDPKSPRTATPVRARRAAAARECSRFQASWNRKGWCDVCGGAEEEHSDEARRHGTPTLGSAAKRHGSPRAGRSPRAGYMASTAAAMLRDAQSRADREDAVTRASPVRSASSHGHHQYGAASPHRAAASHHSARPHDSDHSGGTYDLAAHRTRAAHLSNSKLMRLDSAAGGWAESQAGDDGDSDVDHDEVLRVPFAKNDPCRGSSHRRRVCRSFAPLWNHNDFCSHCYNPRSQHRVASSNNRGGAGTTHKSPNTSGGGATYDSALRLNSVSAESPGGFAVGRRRRHKFGAVGLDEETVARFCSLPWHYILTFCSVDDLLLTAQTCRLLTLAARPLLHSTMTIVLSYPPPAPPADIREAALDIAEVLVAEGDQSMVHIAAIGAATDLLATFTPKFDRSTVTARTLSDCVALFRQLATVVPQQRSRLPRTFGTHVDELLAAQRAFQTRAPDSAIALAPLVSFAHSVWHQQQIQNRAQRYLAADHIPV